MDDRHLPNQRHAAPVLLSGASQNAAKTIAPCASCLHRIALRALDRLGEAKLLEAVAIAEVTSGSMQPRVYELRAMDLDEPTGGYPRNPCDKASRLLRLTTRGRETLVSGMRDVVWLPARYARLLDNSVARQISPLDAA